MASACSAGATLDHATGAVVPPSEQAQACCPLCRVLASPRPGYLALYRWLPLVWDPGHESLERRRLAAVLRAEGWALVSEEQIGDPVAGTLYLFKRCE